MAEGTAELATNARAPVDESTTALRRYISHYLSQAHRDDIDHGCPVAGFAGDAPRLGAGAQSRYAGGLDDQITILAGLIAESRSLAVTGERRTLREQAISLHCEMVGALVPSRSVVKATPALSNELLESVQRHALASTDERSTQPPNPRKKHKARPPPVRVPARGGRGSARLGPELTEPSSTTPPGAVTFASAPPTRADR